MDTGRRELHEFIVQKMWMQDDLRTRDEQIAAASIDARHMQGDLEAAREVAQVAQHATGAMRLQCEEAEKKVRI